MAFKKVCLCLYKKSYETWTTDKKKNEKVTETVGFVPLTKRLAMIDNASLVRRQYLEAIYGDDDILLDENGNMLPDEREDSFDDFDFTQNSEFSLVDVSNIENGIKERKKIKKSINAEKVAQKRSESVSEPKKTDKEVSENE